MNEVRHYAAGKAIIKYIITNRSLYLMMVPGFIVLVLFKYLPMYGIIIAFKDFNFTDGILGSPWVGFENFRFITSSKDAWQAIRNTVFLNFSFIIVHTFVQIALALLLNDIAYRFLKKVSQTLILFPHFISWIIISVFTYNLFNYEFGSINTMLKSIGMNPVDFNSMPKIWPAILVLIDTWKHMGYGMIIFLAVLVGISPEYYESAVIDGANKWHQIRYISIPFIMPSAVLLSLMAVGRILQSDFGMFYGIIGDNAVLFSTTDVLDTYVYRTLKALGDIGMSSATSFLQSVCGLILVLGSNLLARKYQEDGALF